MSTSNPNTAANSQILKHDPDVGWIWLRDGWARNELPSPMRSRRYCSPG